MANAGLAALAASLESLGGSGGDKFIGAWNTYGKNKFLAERARRLGLFDQPKPVDPAPTPVDPIQQIIAPQAAPPPMPAQTPDIYALMNGAAPLAAMQNQPIGPAPMAAAPPPPPQANLDILSSIVGGMTPNAPPPNRSALAAQRTWSTEMPNQLQRMAEYQQQNITPDASIADRLTKAQDIYNFTSSSPYGQDLLGSDRAMVDQASKDLNAEQERVRKEKKDQAKLSFDEWKAKAQKSSQYERLQFQDAAAEAKRKFDAEEAAKDRNLRKQMNDADNAVAWYRAKSDAASQQTANDIEVVKAQLAGVRDERLNLFRVAGQAAKLGEAGFTEEAASLGGNLGLTKTEEVDGWFGKDSVTRYNPEKFNSLNESLSDKQKSLEESLGKVISRYVTDSNSGETRKTDSPKAVKPDKPAKTDGRKPDPNFWKK